MDSIKTSEVKTAVDGFNNLPERLVINEMIHGSGAEVVDFSMKSYWENKDDTLVVSFSREDAVGLAGMMKFAHDKGVDELDYVIYKNLVVVRMWWD